MIHSGQPAKEFIDSATRHVLLRQGVLGIKVKIMRGSDPEGKSGPMSQDYGAKALAAQQAAQDARAQEGGEEGGAAPEEGGFTQE